MSIRLKTRVFPDSLSKRLSWTWRLPSYREEDGHVSVDIYLYLEYGVAVPSVAVAIQKAV